MAISDNSAKGRGIQLLREGSVTKSIDFLLEALSEDGNDIEVHLFLAAAYAQQEAFEKAVSLLERAVELEPDSAKIHYNLGIAYHRAQNLSAAKDEFVRAVNLDPDYEPAKKALIAVGGQ